MTRKVRDRVDVVTTSTPVATDKAPVRQRQARRRKAGTRVATTRYDPAVVAVALRLAGGDPGRLVLEPGGSILVRNRRRGL